jgi:hypothetical protein
MTRGDPLGTFDPTGQSALAGEGLRDRGRHWDMAESERDIMRGLEVEEVAARFWPAEDGRESMARSSW